MNYCYDLAKRQYVYWTDFIKRNSIKWHIKEMRSFRRTTFNLLRNFWRIFRDNELNKLKFKVAVETAVRKKLHSRPKNYFCHWQIIAKLQICVFFLRNATLLTLLISHLLISAVYGSARHSRSQMSYHAFELMGRGHVVINWICSIPEINNVWFKKFLLKLEGFWTKIVSGAWSDKL